jgi:adenylate kinase family enzyme
MIMEKNNNLLNFEKKIVIIGSPGSGKTTLSFQLHHIFNVPIIHLDKYYWKPHWQMPTSREFYDIHGSLCIQPEWIMEGMFITTLIPRFIEADIIIFLDMPQSLCFWRVLTRLIKNYGKVLATSAEYCPQRIDFAFLKYVWNFDKNVSPTIYQILKMFASDKQIYILKSQKEVTAYIEQYKR